MARGSRVTRTLVWVMLGLLFVGLAGVGVDGLGDGVRRIGTVGDTDLGVDDYARALRAELAAQSAAQRRPVSFAEAQAAGLDAQVRQRLVTMAALDDLTARAGLSVGDARLADEIRGIDAFAGVTGAFDREVYRLVLRQNDFTEAEFEARVRADMARALVERAAGAPLALPAAFGRTIYAWAAETRDVRVLRLTEDDLAAPLPDPSEADLRAHHAADPAPWTAPEARRITYAALLPAAIVDEVPVDEATLRAAYDERIALYVRPERRLVERLAFPDAASAAAARDRLDAGAATFDDLVAERGLSLGDVDLGDLALADLGEAGGAVFAAEAPGVVGPLPSPLGPALFRVTAVLAAEETPFEAVRDDLRAEIALDAARRAIADRVAAIDDRLAAGDTLEDLADEPGLVVATIEVTADAAEGMMAYPAFRERAARATLADFPELFALADGGWAALRLDAVVPPALRPFEAVAAEVAASWRAARLAEALAARAAEVEAAVQGGAGLGGFGIVTVLTGLPRDGYVEDAPAALVETAFALPAGGSGRVVEGGYAAIVSVDAIHQPDLAAPEAALLLDAFAEQTSREAADDALFLFSRAVEARLPVRLDADAIEAVHATVQ